MIGGLRFYFLTLLVCCITQLVQSQSDGGICVAETNRERARHGLRALTSHKSLIKAAINHNNLMIRTGCYEHSCPGEPRKAGQRAKKVGFPGAYVAENIDVNRKNCKEALKSWMNSSGHKKNILGGYTHIGCAAGNANGKRYKRFYTCLYGKPT